MIFAARLLFIYGTYHWFSGPLGQFLAAHQLGAAGLTNALIFMAIALALARTAHWPADALESGQRSSPAAGVR